MHHIEGYKNSLTAPVGAGVGGMTTKV